MVSGHFNVHPVLFLHSSGLGGAQWARARGAFSRSEAPDLGDYGDEPWSGPSAFHWIDDLALAERALERLGDAHVVGHSYGAFLALQLARRHPVRSVVAWEPVAFRLIGGPVVEHQAAFMDLGEGLEAWIERFLGFWNGEGAWARMSARRRAPFLAHAEKIHAEVLSCADDATPLSGYAEITAPTLLMSGERTRPEATQVCALLAAAAPNGRHEVVPDAGHMGPVTHGPEVLRRVKRWLEEHEA